MNASGKLVGALLLTSCIVAPGVAAAQSGQATTVEEVVRVTGGLAAED